MDDGKVMSLLIEAMNADFQRRNQIGIDLARDIEIDDLKAVFRLLYVQFCQEKPNLLPYLYPFVAAIAGDRSPGLFAGRIEMRHFTNYLQTVESYLLSNAERARLLREHDLRGDGYARSHPREDDV